MPQLAPLNWLFFFVFLFGVLFVFFSLVWWGFKYPVILSGKSACVGSTYFWS